MAQTIDATMAGTIFKIEASVGDEIDFGDVVAILESMKMEINIEADGAGVVEQILIAEGDTVDSGTPILSYK
ncbi:acetyl-CoA carboxylase biotin carboxyl carrier protein subunit (plasmid) [Pacificitalea manganoxidans]|jgi:biotin carboxyl carrier protein|uniref:Acetyl-CoA carboxylase biotin carboxyl carrier protein subunit n=1 Tax=Pacificitalea manganoxidans TaxID=1411902 RepID=A0A291M3V3_9RHOB|nr:biotin/lipoyl-containing protein [Pacificitalea manganoxidans]ATI43663.1 acetyl-CoA carboxylase biotin carboxyl carrier protein subunit [Pacificitalea manganoxidans]MDR6310055.1 biotin carboxyl carrier protein [Pacificitalea manganoxidans]